MLTKGEEILIKLGMIAIASIAVALLLWGINQATAHDWLSNKKNKQGLLCCYAEDRVDSAGNIYPKDCQETSARRYGMMWHVVNPWNDKIYLIQESQALNSEDERFYICVSRLTLEPRCFFRPLLGF